MIREPDAPAAGPAQFVRHTPWTEASDFAIGLRPIPLHAWFEGEEPPEAVAARKAEVMARAADLAWAETHGSRPAQVEVLRLVAAALGMDAAPSADPPLLAAARLVADDLCLMEKREAGWTLTAASLCASTFFTAAEAVGRPLSGLHAPVPGFNERLLSRVTRIFDALAPDVVVERRNWTLVNSAELFLPDSDPVRARIPAIPPDKVGAALHVRVERQTLRRLPTTGAVLFTIRVWRWPLDLLADDPDRLAAFAEAWRAAQPDFRVYKRLELYDALVTAWLAERSSARRRTT